MNIKLKILLVLAEVAAILVVARRSYADPRSTSTHDVAFKVGTNARINWFEIDNPSVGGVITVANQPYPSTDSLNAAVVDISLNRLIYIDDTNGSTSAFGINLTGLTLVPNATTSVTVSSLGDWSGGNDNAGYNRANGRIYYHVYDSDEVHYLNFDSSGDISGYTTVGTLNGSSFTTPSITTGDLDFDASGKMWVSGLNSGSNRKLWSFDPTTLTVIANKNPSKNYSGIVFDATGTTLYGYVGETGEYGIIDENTGNFQNVLETDTTLFDGSGDLAEGIETIVIPGDFNRDGHVDAGDVQAMEQALTNLPTYQADKGLSNSQLLAIGDINGDGVVNNADLQALLNLLKSSGDQTNPVPEPSTLTLLALGAIGAFSIRRRIR
jgi:hypothetical protein